MNQFDTIIVGAGHNGLVCANYLAKRGKRVLVLEASHSVGGLAATHEFHPGFSSPIAHYASHLPKRIVDELKLPDYGYQASKLNLIGLSTAGDHITLNGDQLAGVSSEDSAAYRDYFELLDKFAQLFQPFWQKTVPPIGNNTFSE
ncbi:MAG: FAD-dependent oxidoreductase, partial [Pseudomonadota bacterium]